MCFVEVAMGRDCVETEVWVSAATLQVRERGCGKSPRGLELAALEAMTNLLEALTLLSLT